MISTSEISVIPVKIETKIKNSDLAFQHCSQRQMRGNLREVLLRPARCLANALRATAQASFRLPYNHLDYPPHHCSINHLTCRTFTSFPPYTSHTKIELMFTHSSAYVYTYTYVASYASFGTPVFSSNFIFCLFLSVFDGCARVRMHRSRCSRVVACCQAR